MISFVFWALVALILFHHLVYPLVLKSWAKNKPFISPPAVKEDYLPTIALIIPAFQEERYIARKIIDSLSLDYPQDKLKIIVACDGCTDKTVEIANKIVADQRYSGAKIVVRDFQINRGKVAVLNQVIAECEETLIALSDVSAKLSLDSLKVAAAHFQDQKVGVVCGTYELGALSNSGEKLYWNYQRAIKKNEASVAAPMGAHGALYFISRKLWSPLPLDTINDDFVLPMQIVAAGYRAVYDPSIIAVELEPTRLDQDYRRRIRISAGNIQQTLRLWRLASPRNFGLAFLFVAGKGLRAFMPVTLFLAFWLNVILAISSEFYSLLLVSQALLYGLALTGLVKPLSYLISGHFAGLIGTITYFIGFERAQWIQNRIPVLDEGEFISPFIRFCKRASDIIGASIIFMIFMIFVIPLAILIKLDSKGPVFFRQLRVGISTRTETKLFYLVKFRTMTTDAETKSGAVWASKNDPRVTKIGGFLRKTRLDELPQAINVLRGEMAIVGPRPERPAFFNKLEEDIPFFSERVCNLKPGITGLAQVQLGYPVTIAETREKVMLDHAYAMRISRAWSWLKTDTAILFQTVGVVIYKKGH